MSQTITKDNGYAKLAIWNGMRPGREHDFEMWHSHIHFQQKRESGVLTSGSRYIADTPSGPNYFTLYESREREAFGPAGYAIPSPTVAIDRAIREDFVGFIRGVFVTELSIGFGTAGWLATVTLEQLAGGVKVEAWNAALSAEVGANGLVSAQLCSYDHETTTSFVLRLQPLPTLPAEQLLLLLRGIDRASLTRMIERLPSLIVDHSLDCNVVSEHIFMLQHEFLA